MVPDDFLDMGCERYREALSARLDGAEEPAEQAAVDAHLADCPACRRWFDDAAAVTRRVRLGAAPVGSPGLDVAALVEAAPGLFRRRSAGLLRVALGVLGGLQALLGIVQLSAAAGHQHGVSLGAADPGHLWHESAAWNVAVGAGFCWIAIRRATASGIVPMLTVFVLVLVLSSMDDLLADRVGPARLGSHVLLLAGYAVVVLLVRLGMDDTPPGDRMPGPRWRVDFDHVDDDADQDLPAGRPTSWRRRPRHDQTGRRSAA